MPWVRFDDRFATHRKVDGLSDTAFRLHVAAIFWCASNLTDGLVPEEDLDLVCARVRAPERFAAECVRRKVWHEARLDCTSDTCPSPVDADGWVIHDYLEYQPSKDEAEAARREMQEKKSSGGRLGNHRRWHVNGVTKDDCPWCPSVSDRSPIGGSDGYPITPSRPGLSVVDVVNQSSGRNAHGREDDDDLPRVVVDAIRLQMGRTITAEQARIVAAKILDGKRPRDPAAYLSKAIANEDDPLGRWLGRALLAPAPPPKPPWCGHCDESTRLLGEDNPGRCPACHPFRESA